MIKRDVRDALRGRHEKITTYTVQDRRVLQPITGHIEEGQGTPEIGCQSDTNRRRITFALTSTPTGSLQFPIALIFRL